MQQESQTLTSARRWRTEGPAVWARECLGVSPTQQQIEAGKALVEKRRVSIRSGHGTGKSAFLSWCILWFLSTHHPAKCPATAPTAHQLDDVLWAEIARWLRVLQDRMPAYGGQLVWSGERVYRKTSPAESFAVARTARPEAPEALQGFHSENLLFLIDEASGVSDRVFEVAEGALSTRGAYVIMTANPTRQSGYFYDSHHSQRARWAALHWSGVDSPMVSKEYVDGMLAKYGAHSPIYKVRVLGEFVGAADGVIPLEWCESARVRDVEPTTQRIIWGVDVARFGDDSSAIAKRQGNVMLAPVREWWGKDTMQTTGMVKAEWDKTPPQLRPAAINVDVIGIGAGVVDRLKELGLPVVGVNVAEAESANARADIQFNRLRDELWWKGREWLEKRDCRLADDDETIAELTTPTYAIQSNGKIKVEGKDEMKKRGVKSPNRADAWLLTFHEGGFPGRKLEPIKYSLAGIV